MSGVKRLNLDWQTCFIKILAFKTTKFVRISELIRNDPGLADRLIVAFMRVAIHPEDRLVGLNDLHHVQGIERRRERAALVFGVGIDNRCIMADDHARTTQILAKPVQQFRREVFM